jgi:hypothetical protein
VTVFDDAKLKLARARKHILTAERLMKDFTDAGAYRMTIEVGADKSQTLVAYLNNPLPAELPCVVSDAVHNLACPSGGQKVERCAGRNGRTLSIFGSVSKRTR